MEDRIGDLAPRIERLADGAAISDDDRMMLRRLAALCADREMLTTGDLARHFGVAINTIKAWHRAGMMPGAITANGRLLFPLQAIAEIEAEFTEIARRNREKDFAFPTVRRDRAARRAY